MINGLRAPGPDQILGVGNAKENIAKSSYITDDLRENVKSGNSGKFCLKSLLKPDKY